VGLGPRWLFADDHSVLRHFVISGRDDAIPKVDGVDLSGFSARAAVKIF
jgi:hypothetical protein